MKYPIIPCLLALLLVGCKPSTQSSFDELTFETITEQRHVKMVDGREQPSYEIDVSLQMAVGDSHQAELVNKALNNFLFCQEQVDTKRLLTLHLDSIENEYREELNEMYEPDGDNETLAYTYMLESFVVQHTLSSVLVFQHNMSAYLGGAHGGYYTFYANVRKSDCQLLTASDVFRQDKMDEIKMAIMNQLLEVNDCASQEELQEQTGITMLGEVYVNDHNFLLLSDKVLFIYNIYEIAPYACGAISVEVPYSELESYMNISTDGTDK